MSLISRLCSSYLHDRMDSSLFTYDLPANAIAQAAIEPRDASRLLVADTLDDRYFTDLPDLLDPGDVVVVNNTRVRPARVRATKDTGGAVEVLLTKRIDDIKWEALVRPARRIRDDGRLAANDGDDGTGSRRRDRGDHQ